MQRVVGGIVGLSMIGVLVSGCGAAAAAPLPSTQYLHVPIDLDATGVMVPVLKTEIGAGTWLVTGTGTTNGVSTCELTDGNSIAASAFGVGSVTLLAFFTGPRTVELRCGSQTSPAHVMYCLCELDLSPAGQTLTWLSTMRVRE